jgi:DNA-directed RNA polymerase specialized sigma24 family protein
MSISWHEIRDHLMHSSSILNFQHHFDAIGRTSGPLGSFGDPAALLDALHVGGRAPDEKNQLLVALVRVAQSGGETADCALTLMLLALWPGLDAVRRRSIWRRIGTRDEVASEILARASEAIRGLDLQRVNWIAATILRNIERDMARACQRKAAQENLSSAIEPDDIPAEQAGCWPTVEDAHFGDDLRKLIGTDAALVIRVAIDGFTQAEAAADLGIPMEAARKRYQRAIRRLREAFQKNV